MRTVMCVMTIIGLLLSGCSKVADAPSAEKLRRDLVGREFYYAYDWKTSAGKKWTVKDGEIKNLCARKGSSRDSGKACEIPADVNISDGKLTIQGELMFRYIKAENEWKLSLVSARKGKPGKSFSFLVLVCGDK